MLSRRRRDSETLYGATLARALGDVFEFGIARVVVPATRIGAAGILSIGIVAIG